MLLLLLIGDKLLEIPICFLSEYIAAKIKQHEDEYSTIKRDENSIRGQIPKYHIYPVNILSSTGSIDLISITTIIATRFN